ncbi:leucine-rich repeat-containing G-protein coupled receptor 5-like [Polyodon spathula]|uniref:leucine-rich repeat-containing G-protein coupled receptor 5-like n=1 Tax=Polyodon spathula TaxID=7913 RepID=UPI001B7E4E36|nr:leucine-rich repeat-containing G-protein coupled receptor 5-like [Polyodon spathula]
MAPEGQSSRTVLSWCFLLLFAVAGVEGEGCRCLQVNNFSTFNSSLNVGICCLNFSGSVIGTLHWSDFATMRDLKILDLSASSITEVKEANAYESHLEVLYLNHNQIGQLPGTFLANAPSLKILHLENNKLQKLPDTFLQASTKLEELHLNLNYLSSVPPRVFNLGIQTIELSNNTLECTCAFIDELKEGVANISVLGNLTCTTPGHLQGRSVWSLQRLELCRNHRLTALFILMALGLIVTLVLCCYCRRKKRGKQASLDLAKHDSQLVTVDRNGVKGLLNRHHYAPCEAVLPDMGEKNVLLKNQIMFRPSTALLGSSRDLYEEVEIKLGTSMDSLPQTVEEAYPNLTSIDCEEEPAEESKPDMETVSVTEVLKDSTDREKMYLTQSTDYYNLVPDIDLDDSDHYEYESVDLS